MFSRYSYLLIIGLLSSVYLNAKQSQDNYIVKFSPMLPASSHQVQADFERLNSGDAVFADFNGDGHLDFIENGISKYKAGYSPNITTVSTFVYINDGNNNYIKDISINLEDYGFGSILPIDIDGDEDLDILMSGLNKDFVAKTVIYKNDGDANFTFFQFLEVGAFSFEQLDYADVDNDGDNDILASSPVWGFWQETSLYINDGSGNFTEDEDADFVDIKAGSATFGDVNGDNHPDIILAGQDGSDVAVGKIYINNGSGTFNENTSSNFVGLEQASISIADLDNDGDQDIILTGKDLFKTTKTYFNDGSGVFSTNSVNDILGIGDGENKAFDADNDGDIDIFFPKNNSTNLYLNDGNGIFTESTGNDFQIYATPFIDVADVDQDGDQDLFISGGNISNFFNSLYINDGSGTFTKNELTPLENLSEGDAAFADVDGDGDKDVIISGVTEENSLAEKTQLYFNDGTGQFHPDTSNDLLGIRTNGEIKFADLDNDGDQDLILTSTYTPFPGFIHNDKIFLNDGNGLFSEHVTLEGTTSSSIDIGDVDNDNDLDIIITGGNHFTAPTSKLYLNDGAANFTENTTVPFIGVQRGTGTFADVDGDNDLDVLITGVPDAGGNQNTLYLNDGAGNFTVNEDNSFLGIFQSTTNFGDFDNDGDLDLFQTGLTLNGSDWTPHALLYLNDGTGMFTQDLNSSFVPVGGGSVDIHDVNNDGNLDIIITGQEDNLFNMSTKVYYNDGTALFSENTPFDFLKVVYGRLLFEDLDNDNDKDLFILGNDKIGTTTISRFYRNESCVPDAIDTVITTCDTLVFDGNILTTSGSYEFMYTNQIGCDSVVTVDLTILESTDTLITTSECDNYSLNGTFYDESGIYNQLITNSAGCDSTIVLDLTILESTSETIDREQCDSLEVNGEWFTASGVYQQILTNHAGCDSTLTVNVNILEDTFEEIDIEACDSIEINGESYTSSGIYFQNLTNLDGCDSTLTINLNILESTFGEINVESCENYIVNGEALTTSGVYIQNLTNTAGCDSTLTINLSILEPSEETINQEACGSYELNGNTYVSSGTYAQHLTNEAGCDSLLTLNLTILESTEEILEVETCDSYNFNGEVLTESCEFTQILTNSVGCDSTLTLHLTILESTTETIYIENCDSYSLNGETYNSSGVYVQNLTNVAGCDSTLTINLEIGQTTYEDLIIEACESYEFNGTTYETSGFHEIITNNSSGCEHITYLNLTILEPTSETIIETGCDNVTINGETYYQAGVYEQHLTNVAGCDSTLTIDLLLMESTEGVLFAESCDSYELNGESYSTTGIYIQNLTNEAGCDSTLTLNLEITAIDTDVSRDDRTFTVNELDADRYQWIDCITNEPISGANERSYKTRVSGEFAVEIIKNGCVDTSACQQIIVTSLAENEFSNSIKSYPNPAREKVTMEFPKSYKFIRISSYSIGGKEIQSIKFNNTNKVEFPIEKAPSGLILLNIITSEGSRGIIKIQKE